MMPKHISLAATGLLVLLLQAYPQTPLQAQVDPDHDDADGFIARYPKAQVRNFDGKPEITELDAMIAYLQVLGTLVDFSVYEAEANYR